MKNALSLPKNRNPVPGKQLFIIVLIQSTNYCKKELFNLIADNKIQEFIGDVFCPTCENEKCVCITTNGTSSLYYCKKCKANCHLLRISFEKQKPKLTLFGGDSIVLQKRRVATTISHLSC